MSTELENQFDSIGAYAGEAVMDLPEMTSVAGILEPMVAGHPTSFDENSDWSPPSPLRPVSPPAQQTTARSSFTAAPQLHHIHPNAAGRRPGSNAPAAQARPASVPVRQLATGVHRPVNTGSLPVTVRRPSAATPTSISQGAAVPPINRPAVRSVHVPAASSFEGATPQRATGPPGNRPAIRSALAPAASAAGAQDEALESDLAPVVHAKADAVNEERQRKFQEHRLTLRLLRGKLAQRRNKQQLVHDMSEKNIALEEKAVALEQKKN
ncbi:uncharacterized protein LOC144144828 [Haemaphysalis longicornis]